MRRLRSVLLPVTLAAAAAAVAAQGRPGGDADALFDRFFQARTAEEIASASDAIAASGIGFDEAYARLKRGRTYAPTVPRGIVQASHRNDSGEYFYTLDVPQAYDPARRYQVRVQLHGGVGRMEKSAPPASAPAGRLAGVQQIYVYPYAWRDAPWWSRRQLDSLRTILDALKRTYNVDENRVVLSGVSDGGTAAYFYAMRDPTPYASFLPLNGHLLVLKNEIASADGDVFPNNLRNRPLFVVNGGRDPLYPTSVVDPVLEQLKLGGVDVEYHPQALAGHDTSWWPEVQDAFERFVGERPRQALPDTLTWETSDAPARAFWLVVDRLADARATDAPLPDLNEHASRPVPDFGVRSSGPQINRVAGGSNAQQIGLQSGDVVTAINGQPIAAGADLGEMLRGFPPGRPLVLAVTRNGASQRLTGRYAPTVIAGDAEMLLPPERASGRVDVMRTGNIVDARTRRVGAFTLLVSPDQFDLTQPVTVIVNGRPAVEQVVQKNLRTLLAWAGRDNDRSMLFAAELRVEVP